MTASRSINHFHMRIIGLQLFVTFSLICCAFSIVVNTYGSFSLAGYGKFWNQRSAYLPNVNLPFTDWQNDLHLILGFVYS